MLSKILPALVLAAACAAPQHALAKDEAPLELEPSSRWIMDYAEDSCALRRTFGEPENQVWLELRQFAPGFGLQTTVASASLDTVKRDWPRVRFEPADEDYTARGAIYGQFGEDLDGVIFTGTLRYTDADFPEHMEEAPRWDESERDLREASITAFRIARAFERDLVLATGSLDKPMQAMRTCLDELLTHWGIDVEAHHTLSREVIPRRRAWLIKRVQERYPDDMLSEGRSGIVRVRLMVDEEGQPSECVLQAPTQDESFRRHTCDTLMRYARFDPALTAEGHPIASYWAVGVTYKIY